MPRPRHCFCKMIRFNPKIIFFKPQGIPLKELQIIELSLEELEAYRLRHAEDFDQQQAAEQMKASTSTYQRILYSAYKKIAEALTTGKAIKIIKHN
ncbi:MAG TPA: DUF134 domain-containing protein [bacterium]|mgnify:CR=1 FL=1|nr:DUF134 domain-containing protein [bacterium]